MFVCFDSLQKSFEALVTLLNVLLTSQMTIDYLPTLILIFLHHASPHTRSNVSIRSKPAFCVDALNVATIYFYVK